MYKYFETNQHMHKRVYICRSDQIVKVINKTQLKKNRQLVAVFLSMTVYVSLDGNS